MYPLEISPPPPQEKSPLWNVPFGVVRVRVRGRNPINPNPSNPNPLLCVSLTTQAVWFFLPFLAPLLTLLKKRTSLKS